MVTYLAMASDFKVKFLENELWTFWNGLLIFYFVSLKQNLFLKVASLIIS